MSNFKEMVCSHSVKDKRKTCYSNESLNKLSEYWNKRHPDDKIKNGNIKTTWSKLKNKLSNVCNKESCWLKQQFVNGELNNE